MNPEANTKESSPQSLVVNGVTSLMTPKKESDTRVSLENDIIFKFFVIKKTPIC